MEYFTHVRSREESDLLGDYLRGHFEKYGWGFWSATLLDTGEHIGFKGHPLRPHVLYRIRNAD